MIKVLLLSRYGDLGASSRLRSYQYIPYLKKNGIDFEIAPLLENQYLINLYSGYKQNRYKIFISYLERLFLLL